jgi:hypothetical protein
VRLAVTNEAEEKQNHHNRRSVFIPIQHEKKKTTKGKREQLYVYVKWREDWRVDKQSSYADKQKRVTVRKQ